MPFLADLIKKELICALRLQSNLPSYWSCDSRFRYTSIKVNETRLKKQGIVISRKVNETVYLRIWLIPGRRAGYQVWWFSREGWWCCTFLFWYRGGNYEDSLHLKRLILWSAKRKRKKRNEDSISMKEFALHSSCSFVFILYIVKEHY